MEREPLLVGLDDPRPLPADVRDRLEGLLVSGSGGSATDVDPSLLAEADGPRPIPSDVRRRLEVALASERTPERAWLRDLASQPHRVALGVATAVAVVASLLVVVRAPNPEQRPPASRAIGGSSGTDRAPAFGPHQDEPLPGATERPSRSKGIISRPPRAGEGSGAPPPPFASVGDGAAVPWATTAAPIRVAVAGGDAAQEAGFGAYVDVLNDADGVRGRRLDVVESSEDAPAAGAVATVNLSGRVIAGDEGPPGWTRGALLETLSATQDVLAGDVFSFASPPERQAHLLADAVFPQPDPSAVAVVYKGTEGVFADSIPEAFVRVLEARDVTVVEATYEPGRPAPLVPADAVFLSLDQQATRYFLDYARRNGYLTTRTIACIFPMFDGEVVEELGDGYLVLSPYALGDTTERTALEQRTGLPAGTSTIHGWVSAKSLAMALWRSGVDEGAESAAALRGLDGFDSGFAPPYRVRPGTNARTPEGILYEVRSGAFVPVDGFRVDPF